MTNTKPEFQFNKHQSGEQTVLELKGIINERTSISEVFDSLDTKQLTINLDGISRINSCGVRDWVNACHKLPENIDITYDKCSRAIVEQMNMIVNFLKSGKIISFNAPYYCDACDAEHDMLIVIDEHYKNEDDLEDPEAPDFDCPVCSKTMEFNEDEEKYLSFLID